MNIKSLRRFQRMTSAWIRKNLPIRILNNDKPFLRVEMDAGQLGAVEDQTAVDWQKSLGQMRELLAKQPLGTAEWIACLFVTGLLVYMEARYPGAKKPETGEAKNEISR